MTSSKSIAIIGGGTAGAASALFLTRAGHRVTLYERVPEPSAIGAGILLQPSGMHVLQALGLLDDIVAHGARIQQLFGTTPKQRKQRTVLDVRYSDFASNSFGLGLHRGALFSVLWNAAKQTGMTIKTGTDITACQQKNEHVALYQNETLLGTYDCAIVADGTRSHVRDNIAIPNKVTHYPWGALWAVVPDDGMTSGVLRQWFRDARQMLGVMPTGFAYQQMQQPVLSLFWSLHKDALQAWHNDGLQAWKDTVLALAPIETVLNHIHSADQLTYASYADVQMPHWHDRRVVCIGDCAHATSPQLGQGANLALVDAMTLATCFAQDGDVVDILAAYSRLRKSHLGYYQSASRLLTPFFQSHSRIGSGLRDVGMGTFCRLPFFKGQMAKTLSGTKNGWLFGKLEQ